MLRNLFARKSLAPEPPSAALIELRKVVKSFESPAGRFTALKGIDLRVERGEFLAIIGKSGSGKSTLLNMIAGIDRPSTGEVWMNGTAVHRLDEGRMAVWRGRNLGIVFQFFQLLPTLTVVENVMLPMDLCGAYPLGERYGRAMRLLERMELAEHADKLPTALSGGQQQRVAIARALANDPPILLADEPTGNLDSQTADSVFALFEALAREGTTILMVTHDSDMAKRVRRTVLLSDGEVINEYLARAFPTLSEKQLLAVMHRLKPEHFEPGAVVLRRGEPSDRFYLITRGGVEVVLPQPGGGEMVVATMGAGQYFGEIEMMLHVQNIATVRASFDRGLEAAELSHDEFDALLAESGAAEEAVENVVDERLAENIAARKRGAYGRAG